VVDCGEFTINGVTRPDFQVVLFVDGKSDTYLGSGWSEEKATRIANKLRTGDVSAQLARYLSSPEV